MGEISDGGARYCVRYIGGRMPPYPEIVILTHLLTSFVSLSYRSVTCHNL